MVVVYTLGSAAINIGRAQVTPSHSRAFAALLYLAAERSRPTPRRCLQNLVYPALIEQAASQALRQLLYRMRCSGVPLEGSDPITLAEPVTLDYEVLWAASALRDDQIDAVARGFLPGYAGDGSIEFRDWFGGLRSRVILATSRALLREMRAAREACHWTRVERIASAVLALDSLNGPATLSLAEALAAGGSKARAVVLLEEYMREVGDASAQFTRGAALLRRRISERVLNPASTESTESRFVGRDSELSFLRARLQQARLANARGVIITGEAGIGKSRLATALCRVAALEGARVAWIVCQPHDARRPVGVLVDLVPVLLELPGALGCAPDALQQLRRLTARDGDAAELTSDASEGESNVQSIAKAIRELLDAVTTECTLVVTLDDAQWLDPMSVRFLSDLFSERRPRQLLALLTTRKPGPLALATRHADRVATLRIGSLAPEQIERLLLEALAGVPGANESASLAWMVQASGGNPLFVQSLAAYRRNGGDPFVLPPDLEELLSRRVEGLDRRALTILQACAVLGKNATAGRLHATLGLSDLDFVEGMRDLEDEGFIVCDGSAFRFGHGFFGDAVARRMKPGLAAMLQYRVAQLLRNEAEAAQPPTLQ